MRTARIPNRRIRRIRSIANRSPQSLVRAIPRRRVRDPAHRRRSPRLHRVSPRGAAARRSGSAVRGVRGDLRPAVSRAEAAEYGDVSLEISVLGPIEPVGDISEVTAGRHGLIVEHGPPRVAAAAGGDRVGVGRRRVRLADLRQGRAAEGRLATRGAAVQIRSGSVWRVPLTTPQRLEHEIRRLHPPRRCGTAPTIRSRHPRDWCIRLPGSRSPAVPRGGFS